jgi:hypothetical protein
MKPFFLQISTYFPGNAADRHKKVQFFADFPDASQV